LQPDFQYIINPGAVTHRHDAIVAGLRFTFSY
jgi:carbohydrate-selective porin OprB